MSKWPPARVATEAAEEFYYFPRTRLAIDSDLPSFLEMVGRSVGPVLFYGNDLVYSGD